MIRSADFSQDRIYRYSLTRIWDETKPVVMFIGLNPSTADEKNDDPTIRRCIGFARSWGFGGVITTNLFAYRSVNPAKLKIFSDPVGAENDRFIKKYGSIAERIIASWGNHGTYMNRSEIILKMFPEIYCLRKTKTGQPAHPLYQRKSLLPFKFCSA